MTTVAAVDCGTNSTRLLVADSDGSPLDRRMRITRLGQGVTHTGRLASSAIERTVNALREFRQVMDRCDVSAVRMTATAAARDATNRDEFFQVAQATVGVVPEMLSGDEEGRLSFAGATVGLDADDGPFLVVDIGGGSTELVVGSDEPGAVRSLDLGCVRITEKYLAGDPPAPEELSDALNEVREMLQDTVRELPEVLDARRMIGLAGTVTTVAAVELGLSTYDPARVHHFELTRDMVEEVFRTLATEPLADRVHNPGLEPARADVIVGGCTVLVGIMRFFAFDRCLVSEADLLDGIVLSLLAGAPRLG